MSRIDILMAGPQTPLLDALLAENFNVHRLWEAPDRAAFLAAHAAGIRAVVTNAPVGAGGDLIAALPDLEVISSFGVGLDKIDLEAARRRGIVVASTQGVLTDCVADTGLALLLATARRICEADRFVRAGGWARGKFPLGTALHGKTCGILGLGQIGQAVARRAAGFDMRIAYYDPFPKPELPYARYEDMIDLARAADFLVLTLPGGAETHHVVGTQMLAALGPKGIVVNISRGGVVDTAALIAALEGGVIAGAGLDVFESEPEVPAELKALENVVLTPHLASSTVETREAMARLVLANLEAHFAGRPVLTPVR